MSKQVSSVWHTKTILSWIASEYFLNFEMLFCRIFKFNHYFLQKELLLPIITKGSKAIAKNLYQQKQMKGSNFKEEKNSPKPNSFFQNWTADFCDLQDVQTYIWSSISSCLPLSTPGHNSSQFHQFILSNILDSE